LHLNGALYLCFLDFYLKSKKLVYFKWPYLHKYWSYEAQIGLKRSEISSRFQKCYHIAKNVEAFGSYLHLNGALYLCFLNFYLKSKKLVYFKWPYLHKYWSYEAQIGIKRSEISSRFQKCYQMTKIFEAFRSYLHLNGALYLCFLDFYLKSKKLVYFKWPYLHKYWSYEAQIGLKRSEISSRFQKCYHIAKKIEAFRSYLHLNGALYLCFLDFYLKSKKLVYFKWPYLHKYWSYEAQIGFKRSEISSRFQKCYHIVKNFEAFRSYLHLNGALYLCFLDFYLKSKKLVYFKWPYLHKYWSYEAQIGLKRSEISSRFQKCYQIAKNFEAFRSYLHLNGALYLCFLDFFLFFYFFFSLFLS